MGLGEGLEVRGAYLLLALEDELHTAGERPGGLEPGVEGAEPRREAVLVVGDAAGVYDAVAYLRREGVGVPEVDGVDGLDVVVVVAAVHPRALALSSAYMTGLPSVGISVGSMP